MRIIHVREVANVAQFLVRGLSELGHDVDFLSPGESTEQRVWLKMLMGPRRLLDGVKICAFIRRHGYDIVHLHYANSGWMGTLGRYPYFLHCHGSDVRLDLYHPARRWPVQHSLSHACGIFISTPDLYQHVAPLRPDAVFLPNPIDARIFAPLPNGDHTHARILINQAVKESKAPQVAFGAAQQLKRTVSNLEICAFAYGSDLGRFRDCEEVRFIEPVPHSRMSELINSFDIILGQFAIGSLGVSELESMACGKPVVSYVDQAMYSQWYGDPPPVLSAREVDAVTESVVSLIERKTLREEMGRQGREWILRHHDYLEVASQALSQYRIFLERE